MLLKLAALGTLGYVGYKYLQKNGYLADMHSPYVKSDFDHASKKNAGEPDLSDPHVAMAGGPLSNDAAVIHAGEPLPAG